MTRKRRWHNTRHLHADLTKPSERRRPKSLIETIVENTAESTDQDYDPMLDAHILERRFAPLFSTLGMEDLIRRRLQLAKIRKTKNQLTKGVKERIIKIPADVFENKRNKRLNYTDSSARPEISNSQPPLDDKTAVLEASPRRRRLTSNLEFNHFSNRSVHRSVRSNDKSEAKYFEIKYKDPLVPDEIFYSEPFQKIKKENILLSMNQAVHKFFANKQDKSNRDLVCSWLGSIDGLLDVSLPLLRVLMDYFGLEKYSYEYGKVL